VEIIFQYQRLHNTAKKQLDALKRLDFGTLEKLTRERDDITRELCKNIKSLDLCDEDKLPANIRKKIHELTSNIMELDRDIKDLLLEELSEKTMELSSFSKILE